jgi:formylglycine-generating enzyme required for sulfatase activity
VAVAVGTVWFVRHRAEVQWAREVALPEIERMAGENDAWRNLVPPYRLAVRAEAILGSDPKLAELFSKLSLNIDIRTEPPGARAFMKEYATPDAEWTDLGVTPIEKVRVPIGIFRWKLEKEGYETVLAAASSWNIGRPSDKVGVPSPAALVRTLDKAGSAPSGMVRVPATDTPAGKLEDFFIGRYELTNKEYKQFIAAGGYRTREYWKHTFVKDGRELNWDEAMKAFVDQSGQPGPSTWQGGDYAEGRADFPVSGVSWYEAAAYAQYARMSLPTSTHWNVARGGLTPMVQVPQLGGFAVLAPFSNFSSQGTVAVGSLPGVTAYGAYDMAGNVREWCWNETPAGRAVRGGSWEDNTYEFNNLRQAPAMDRSQRNGFRLALYPQPDKIPQKALALALPAARADVRTQQPCSDEIFKAYKERFAYDKTELKAKVESREESPGGWIRERVSFDAAYGGERVAAYLFLPKNAQPPYQTVIYFRGSAVTKQRSSQDFENYYEFPMFLSFIVTGGRAAVFPIYKGTFERGSPAHEAMATGADTHAYTEYLVQMVKDFRRTIDYLETRKELDSRKLAYYGMSWGGWLGAIIPAVEDRLVVSVLSAGTVSERAARPEVRTINYVTRVKIPTLMLNGRYDNAIDSRIRPMFELLGTPVAHKRLRLFDTDHIPPKNEYIKETQAWLDKYLGPVRW